MITSLCPTLGKRYSIIVSNICPTYLQQPNGKELPVSIMGLVPYVIKNEKKEIVDGAELQIIDIFAKKFNFRPKIIPAPTFDGDGGMVDTVDLKSIALLCVRVRVPPSEFHVCMVE